jgi:predicted Kef-type K+ transport protein
MDRMAIGIIIIPPFIMISNIVIVPGAGCMGSAGEPAMALLSVSIVCVICKKIAVILICLFYYTPKPTSPIGSFNRVYTANSKLRKVAF